MMPKWIEPEHIQIETINGSCTARCTMCTINQWKRPKQIMSIENYELILSKLKKIQNQKFLTLHGLGEPLLDKELPEKVSIAKKMAYRGIGFASNCTELHEEVSLNLLHAGLDTLICSIDGATKMTHERIRIGTNFDSIVKNVEHFITLRNTYNFKTRILVRFINQETNHTEWTSYQAMWKSKLDASKKDDVLRFDVHNWGETEKIKRSKNSKIDKENDICQDLTERLIIQSLGNLSLCCADDNNYFELGNAVESDPLELYNTGHFIDFRAAMEKGNLIEMYPCKECSIIQSRKNRILPEK